MSDVDELLGLEGGGYCSNTILFKLVGVKIEVEEILSFEMVMGP